jgi:hypothetical protein
MLKNYVCDQNLQVLYRDSTVRHADSGGATMPHKNSVHTDAVPTQVCVTYTVHAYKKQRFSTTTIYRDSLGYYRTRVDVAGSREESPTLFDRMHQGKCIGIRVANPEKKTWLQVHYSNLQMVQGQSRCPLHTRLPGHHDPLLGEDHTIGCRSHEQFWGEVSLFRESFYMNHTCVANHWRIRSWNKNGAVSAAVAHTR